MGLNADCITIKLPVEILGFFSALFWGPSLQGVTVLEHWCVRCWEWEWAASAHQDMTSAEPCVWNSSHMHYHTPVKSVTRMSWLQERVVVAVINQ